MIKFSCAGCGQGFKVKPELAGKKVKCPKCGQVGVVPAGGEAGEELAARPAAKPAIKVGAPAAKAKASVPAAKPKLAAAAPAAKGTARSVKPVFAKPVTTKK